MTPPVTPSKQATTSQQNAATPDDVTRHVQMADVASDVLRMRKVKQKLDSVLVSVTLKELSQVVLNHKITCKLKEN